MELSITVRKMNRCSARKKAGLVKGLGGWSDSSGGNANAGGFTEIGGFPSMGEATSASGHSTMNQS